MRREIVMGGCYLGMAGHDVFNNRVREIVNTNEHRVVLLALDISNFKYINDFYGMDEGDKVMQDIADFYFINEPLCLASHGIGFDQFRGAYKADNMTDEDVYCKKEPHFRERIVRKISSGVSACLCWIIFL